MRKFQTLDNRLLHLVKAAFVSMPAGADPSMGAGPVAGGGMLTQAQASPMGGTPQTDPAMAAGGGVGGGMPTDPAAMGGAMPMDPSMMGAGMPPTDPGAAAAMGAMGGGMPPEAAAGMGAAAAGPTGQIMMSPAEFVEVLRVAMSMGGSGGKKPKADSQAAGGAAPQQAVGPSPTDAKLDQIIQLLGGGMGGGGMMPSQQ